MRTRIGLIVAGIILILGSLLELAHLFDLVDRWMPKSWQPMVDGKLGIIIVIAAWFSTLLIWVEHIRAGHKHSDGKPLGSDPAVPPYAVQQNNSSYAEGGKVEQHFHFPTAQPEEIADAVAKKLKAEDIGKSAPADDAVLKQRIAPNDGFVQLEHNSSELQVPSTTLAVGQSISFKYWYANRGGRPVYEVQTWGLLQVLDATKNSGDHLKAVMIAAAEDGYEKFPGGAALGVNQRGFAFAVLSEPFTQDHIDALRENRQALFLLICGVWKDNQDQVHYWSACQRAELPQTLSVKMLNWLNL